MSKGFHEKLLKFATGIGMGGLGYLEVLEDLSYKGPIDKFIPDDMKKEFLELAGLEAGDLVQSLTYWKRTHTVSATLMTSQCLKKTLKQRRLDLHTTHSLCHRAVLKH